MVYETLFFIGLAGIAAQALLGTTGHGHGGHAHGGHHGHAQHNHNGTRGDGLRGRAGSWLLGLLSPLTIFSICLGIGATGLLLQRLHLVNAMHLTLALLGGVVFYALLVRPIWTLIFQAASEPAKALDGAVAGTAEALSRFDASGKGLVRVNVDGQIVRVLAFLDREDRTYAPPVQPGDQLTILSVDGRANTCRVARL